jgi:Arc/MetJ-type ribon-helix-helix transcriptional regulator
MKASVSLPEEDVRFLDVYARSAGLGSRSAAVHAAIDLLRRHELSAAYQIAWQEWDDSDDAEAWDTTTADGIVADATR